jgi:hypothetical protein
MKRNYVKYTAVFVLGLGVLTSCKKSYLETDPKGKFLQSDYYSTPDEAFAGLVAAYDPLITETGGLDNNYIDQRGLLNSGSDDCNSGGGDSGDTPEFQEFADYSRISSGAGPQNGLWPTLYLGVSRANTIVSQLQTTPISGLTDDVKNRYIAEGLFLRAHYYFDLVRLFKNVPLITKPLAPADIYNQLQAKPADVYAQIEADLTAAIPNLPTVIATNEEGRASQGAAVALLGKVYLYEQKWSQAATELAKVNGPTPGGTTPVYNYHLQANYGSVFSPDNKYNSESIFELNFSPSQAYTWNNWNSFKGDVYCEQVGPRNFSDATYAGGWGINPITTQLVAAFKTPYYGGNTTDPRYGYTVLNMDSLSAAENATYQASFNNTGYFIMKYTPLVKYKATQGTPELNYPNDYIEIRLADTYLMEAEALVQGSGDASRAAALINAVRARVGLGAVAATMDNIKAERRLELATEGHRWYDLVRWGDAGTALAFKNFKAGTNEILPIPLVDLGTTKLIQNPGYAK